MENEEALRSATTLKFLNINIKRIKIALLSLAMTITYVDTLMKCYTEPVKGKQL